MSQWVFDEMSDFCVCICKRVLYVSHEYFVIKIFSDSLAYAKIKYMYTINSNAVQGHMSENYLMQKIIAQNILDMKCSLFTVHVLCVFKLSFVAQHRW